MPFIEWEMQGMEFANCNCNCWLARIHWTKHGIVHPG
jgi:hypothetical protein